MAHDYPVFLRLEQADCLVVGGGQVAERKVLSLLGVGARVKVVSPEVTEVLERYHQQGRIAVEKRYYQQGEVVGYFLVICATNNTDVNKQIASDCHKAKVLFNVVDNPELGNFIVPSVHRQGDLAICVSTNGTSPHLAKKIRKELAELYGSEYKEFLHLMGELRPRILQTIANNEDRKKIFIDFVNSDILRLLKEGEFDKVKERIDHVLGSSRS